MMLCSLPAALNLSSQLHNAHPGITQLLIHVLYIQATYHTAETCQQNLLLLHLAAAARILSTIMAYLD